MYRHTTHLSRDCILFFLYDTEKGFHFFNTERVKARQSSEWGGGEAMGRVALVQSVSVGTGER